MPDTKTFLPTKNYSLRALKRIVKEKTFFASMLISIENFNNYKETAIGQCQMSANRPPTDANYFYGTVIVIKFGSAYCSQLTTDINTGKIYNRVLINGNWTAWKEVQQNVI